MAVPLVETILLVNGFKMAAPLEVSTPSSVQNLMKNLSRIRW